MVLGETSPHQRSVANREIKVSNHEELRNLDGDIAHDAGLTAQPVASGLRVVTENHLLVGPRPAERCVSSENNNPAASAGAVAAAVVVNVQTHFQRCCENRGACFHLQLLIADSKVGRPGCLRHRFATTNATCEAPTSAEEFSEGVCFAHASLLSKKTPFGELGDG